MLILLPNLPLIKNIATDDNSAKITNLQLISHKNTTHEINNTIALSKPVNGENKYADNNSS